MKMKTICLVFASLLNSLWASKLWAQNFPGLNQTDMQQMMESAQKMQACMAEIDHAQLEVLQQKGAQLESRVQRLCASGQRQEAMQLAMDESKKMMADPTIQHMRKCSEMMPAAMNQIVADMLAKMQEPGPADQHICD